MAAYIGPSIPLADLIYEPPHGLERQAYRPRTMASGHVNVDGTGVAWWPEGEAAPMRYVTELPPWSDPNLPHLAPRLHGTVVLATVRSATPGIPGGAGSVLPFVCEGVAGSHNGYLRAFRDSTAAACVAALPPDLVGEMETLSDSRALFLLAVAALREDATRDLGAAAVAAVVRAGDICERAGAEASLNLILADREGIVAVRHARGVESNSLHLRRPGGRWPQGWLVASEPLDEAAGWQEVAPDHVVTLDGRDARMTPMPAVSAGT